MWSIAAIRTRVHRHIFYRRRIRLCGRTGCQSVRRKYNGHYQRGQSGVDAPWWAVCYAVPYTMWIGRRQGSRRKAGFVIFVTNRNRGVTSQSALVSPKTRRGPWCAAPNICVFARVWVCHPIWAELGRACKGRRLVRAPFRCDRWRRFADWKDVHADLSCEATPP
jgi:hypothetical protein